MTHLVSTACVPRRGVGRATDRPTSPTLGGGPGAARQPTDFAVRGKGRAEGKSRTRTDTGDHLRRRRTTRLRSKVGAWRPHSGLLPRWQPRGRPGPGCGKAAVGTDRRRSGTLAVAAALGLVRDPRNGSAPPRGPQGPKVRTSVRHAKPFPGQRQAGQQNPQKHHSVEGGAGGTPGSRFGSRVTFPTEARVRTTSPALRRASPGSPIAFPSSPVLPFFPPNTIENTKRERNKILLGPKEKNTSENFLSCLHKTGASLALCVKILQIFNSNVFGSLAGGEAQGAKRYPEIVQGGAWGAPENFAEGQNFKTPSQSFFFHPLAAMTTSRLVSAPTAPHNRVWEQPLFPPCQSPPGLGGTCLTQASLTCLNKIFTKTPQKGTRGPNRTKQTTGVAGRDRPRP